MSSSNGLLNRGDGLRVAFGVGGIIAVVLGLFIIFFPAQSGAVTMQVVAAVIASYAAIVGIVYLGSALFSKRVTGWTRTGHILLGALYIVGAVVMLLNLGATGAVLAVFLSVTIGVLWLLEGIMTLVALDRSANPVWNVVYGIISIIAGLTLVLSPLLGAVTLWWLLGISLVALGAVQIVRAFQARRAS